MAGYQFDRLRVLVVDDNTHMRTLVSRVLAAFGIKYVYEAATADQAWAVLQDAACDVAFVDWVMPGASGLEFTERVRTAADSPNPFLPIIILTGHTSLDHVSKARDAGVNEFLAKPVSAKAILSRLVAVIDHPRPFVRSGSYFGPCRRRHRNSEHSGPERRTSEQATAAKQETADAA